MKFKHAIIAFAFAFVGGLGTIGALNISKKVEVKGANAYDEGTTYYCLTGKFGGVEHWTDYVNAPSDGKNAGVLLNYTLAKGDTFKFKVKGSWENALTFGVFNSSSGAYNAFRYEKDKDNTYCAVSGSYNFYIYNDSGMKVSVEFADSNTATYSYVLTSDSELGYTHLYNDTFSLRDWGSAPAVSGQGYDIKFTYSAFDYYGLYRIDDRILSGWDHLIMKNSSGSKQATTITRTVGNKQELYLCQASSFTTKASSTDEYKAIAFLYDLISHRGTASYDDHSFAFSICATSPEDAYYLVQRYDGFTNSIKTLLESATVKTYDMKKEYGEGDESKAYAEIEDMVDALRVPASKYNPGSGSRVLLNLSGQTQIVEVIIIVAVSALSLLALGGFFFIRKRKESK